MEILLGLGLVLCLGFLIRYAIEMLGALLKTRFSSDLKGEISELRSVRLAKLDAEIAGKRSASVADIEAWAENEKKEMRARLVSDLDGEISELRNTRSAELDAEIAGKRSASVADIEAWFSDEQERLKTRFVKEYRDEMAKLREELHTKLDSELNNIRKLFAEFSDEEKKLAEEDIKRFIASKLLPGDEA